MRRYDVAVIGGGMVGGAIAYGCASRGASVVLLDEGDTAPRAARGNFGLVWSQGKGDGMPAYAAWTRRSLSLWPDFAERMAGLAGRSVGYTRAGGLVFTLGEEEFATRADFVRRMHNQGAAGLVMLDRAALRALMPHCPLGPEVTGASYQPGDGHADPLALLAGLHAGLHAAGATHLPGAPVVAIEPGFRVRRADGGEILAERVVIAAGLGTTRLAAMVGLDVPVRPVKGQNLVTERLAPLLPLPASALRQTAEGTVQIGFTYEEGDTLETITNTRDLARMAARAARVLPVLRDARIVRSWAALRPMTPDGYPAYAESATMPGAFVATCHSGVTLAAAHAGPLAEAVLEGRLPEALAALSPSRFAATVERGEFVQ